MLNVKRLKGNSETFCLLSNLFVQDHVYYNLDIRIRSFSGMHFLFKGIEENLVKVYGVFDDDKFVGCTFGHYENQEFFVHIAFYRKVDAKKACLLCENTIIKDYLQESINSIVGIIPIKNKSAIRLAKNIGYLEYGVLEKKFYRDNDFLDCLVLKKKVG